MNRRLLGGGAATVALCLSAMPAYAAGASRSGNANCIAVASACSVSGSHSATSFTNWCTVANGVYASCQFSHSCAATARGTLAAGSLACSFAVPSAASCAAGTAGSCSMNLAGSTVVTTSNCATFTVDAKATSPVGGTAQWTHSIIMCVNPNTGPYVLVS